MLAGPYTGLPGGLDEYTGILYAGALSSTLSGYYEFRATTHADTGRSGSATLVLYVDHTPPGVFNPTPENGANTAFYRYYIKDFSMLNDPYFRIPAPYDLSGPTKYQDPRTGAISNIYMREFNRSPRPPSSCETTAPICG